ncbi:hypothetical protein GGR88_000416 [Sphingomonas jejuensis]|uniref:Uncharacterized protein n=1 Tax=Sphingomonas jejuensis TaxID=904715 RepID=A0ABX0XJG3_9SPHN|nr:DUF6445 family protein [Sphingomonas jejuensis]NJC32942.1 hypothetical protein [Sphingomonas jejuensis]
MTPRIRLQHVGAEREPVVIVDDFAPDPDALVAAAQQSEFAPLGEFYPGPRVPAPAGYLPSVGAVLAAVLRDGFGFRDRLTVRRALFSLVTTPPASLSLAQRIPHVDAVDPGAIAIVHYLSRAPLGGTGFFRHRATGFEVIDAARRPRFLAALKDDFARHGEPAAAYIDGDTPVFERIGAVDPAFNRAAIYRGSLLHCARVPDGAVSADPATGRLTIASFLDAA